MDTSNRRSFTGAAAVFFAALCAGASTASAERPNVLPPVPPKPSKNKFIYDLQVQSWKAEPYDRMRLYLQAVTQRFVQELEASAFGGKYFIHWTAEPDSEEFFKFDVVDRDNYNEAARSGQILIDSDISEPEEGIEVYVYKNAEARAELGKTILIQDLVIVPKELQDAIRVPVSEWQEDEARQNQWNTQTKDRLILDKHRSSTWYTSGAARGHDFELVAGSASDDAISVSPTALPALFRLRLYRLPSLQPRCFDMETLFAPTLQKWCSPLREPVVGDIVYLKSGDCAPWDLRVLKTLEDTRIDTSTGVGSEVRDCTECCTSADPLSSDNIVIKGSWILQGSLLAVVIRTSMDPLAPHLCANDSDQDVEFAIDVTIPSGLTAASCQTSFSNLWTKANCICRSFEIMAQLSAVDAVIIFLTEDLRKDASALQDTVRDLHGLGKAVFLLVKDQGIASRLAEDLKLKQISFEKGKQTPSTCVSSIGSLDVSFEGDVTGTCSGTPTPRRGQEEERIEDLMNSCKAAVPGAVVHGMSEAALVQFCLVMQEAGLSPMYVASQLQSQFLRALSDPTFRSQAPSVSSGTQVQHFPSRASRASQEAASPRRTKAVVKTRTEAVDHGEAHNLTDVIKSMGFAELNQVGEKNAPKRASSLTIVSLNATGVLADRCSCACLRSDLRCVGHALQLAPRSVPKT
ncbi:ATP4A [Symbiodinium necroappetens]|uniref:ATP4A protein n=1 Tax=Symbiodinium necroappetens TaxID=1628268 RepID=A0A813ADI4_9DINO|nr:ATP4A [Symbiodinium necroappetens]